MSNIRSYMMRYRKSTDKSSGGQNGYMSVDFPESYLWLRGGQEGVYEGTDQFGCAEIAQGRQVRE